MNIAYQSTRGGLEPITFSDTVLTGLAPDGGLIIPREIPDCRDQLAAWAQLPYTDLAFEITRLFTDLPEEVLHTLLHESYASFRHPEITPVVPVGDLYMAELFHGPTLAFKDVALQWLGHLFEYLLDQRGGRLNILAATSGDTGSAAIHGVRGREHIDIFVMHPDGRVSPIQERQMTTVLDANVHNLAVAGTFDDCQNIMKALFRDLDFKQRCQLGSVNSVNWARVLAQMVYFFYTGLRVMKKTGADQIRFSVPTGNFGDILAGYFAARMGLPVERLILATNENDILCRFFQNGDYSTREVVPTLSPSMDIQVASNFERYLFYKMGEDSQHVKSVMDEFEQTGVLSVAAGPDGCIDPLFRAQRGHTKETLEVIGRYQREAGYLMDPHTAVGVYAAEEEGLSGTPIICLATAHPAKFSEAIEKATGQDLAHHPILDGLSGLESRQDHVPAQVDAVREYVENHIPKE